MQTSLVNPQPANTFRLALRLRRLLPILTVTAISGLAVTTYQISFGLSIFSGSGLVDRMCITGSNHLYEQSYFVVNSVDAAKMLLAKGNTHSFWVMAAHDLHHGGEIGCLRDLYRAQQARSMT